MNPKFAAHIDPLFEYVLNLLERADDGREPDPEVEKTRIRNQLERIDASLGNMGSWREDWKLARYALVAWVDECLVYGCTWAGASHWQGNLLEVDLYVDEFQTGIAAEEFFKKAEEAAQLKRKDALEVYYLAVILGFRGFYRDDVGSANVADSTLKKWLKKTAVAINAGQPKIKVPREIIAGEGAPALRGKFEFLGAFVWLTVLLSILAIMFAARLIPPS